MGGGGQSSTSQNAWTQNPAALGLLQQQYAGGNFAPQQNFQLHENQLDPSSQAAIDYGMQLGRGQNPLWQQINQIGGQAGNQQLQAYGDPNSYYQSLLNGTSGNVGYQQLAQLAQGGGLSGEAGGAINNAIGGNWGNNPGWGGLSQIAQGNLQGQSGDYLRQLISGGGINGAAGDYMRQLIQQGTINGPGGQYLSDAASGHLLDKQNPFFQDMVNQNELAAQGSLGSQYAGSGRYGSGSFANALADASSRYASQLGYQNYAKNQDLQAQAAGQLTGLQSNASNTMAGLQGNAANTMAGLQATANSQLGGYQSSLSQLMAQLQANAAGQVNQTGLAGAQGLSGNIENYNQNQINLGNQRLAGAGLLANNLAAQQSGLLNSANLDQQFQLGKLADQANQFNYDQRRPALGFDQFAQFLSPGNGTQSVMNTGGSSTGQALGAGAALAGTAATVAIAI